MKEQLFFCRTPLHALIVQEIRKRCPGNATIVYYPVTHSVKHKLYYQRIATESSVFVPYRSFKRDLYREIYAYYGVPGVLRRKIFDEYYIGSIGSLVFALLASKNPGAPMFTFDDGTFNLNPTVLLPWIYDEAYLRRAIKRIAGARTNRDIFEGSVAHYTIFSKDEVITRSQHVMPINLFARERGVMPNGTRLTVFLGTRMLKAEEERVHAELCNATGKTAPDILIPHYWQQAAPVVRQDLSDLNRIERLVDQCIAEEVLFELYQAGYDLDVYGFSSTALINLRDIAHVTNIEIDGDPWQVAEALKRLGIPSIDLRRKEGTT